jgi:hypothetical protein
MSMAELHMEMFWLSYRQETAELLDDFSDELSAIVPNPIVAGSDKFLFRLQGVVIYIIVFFLNLHFPSVVTEKIIALMDHLFFGEEAPSEDMENLEEYMYHPPTGFICLWCTLLYFVLIRLHGSQLKEPMKPECCKWTLRHYPFGVACFEFCFAHHKDGLDKNKHEHRCSCFFVREGAQAMENTASYISCLPVPCRPRPSPLML